MSQIFSSHGIKTPSHPTPKMHITTGLLPPYTNPSQPPTKRSPWRQIQDLPFISTVRLILPLPLYNQIHTSFIPSPTTTTTNTITTTTFPSSHPLSTPPRYYKILTSLHDLLTTPFFTTYIKTPGSNIILLSQGQPGISNEYSLRNGILRLDLCKEDYQRAGLQGTLIKNHGGRKHGKEWWRVEINLRSPGMVRGRKGFDRLVWACRGEEHGGGGGGLGRRVNWIMRDLNEIHGNDEEKVIMKYHPTIVDLIPQVNNVDDVLIPRMVSKGQYSNDKIPPPELLDDYYDIIEWLDLVGLDSPRIRHTDQVDPYISRYSIPYVDVDIDNTNETQHPPVNLKVITWTGLIDTQWLIRLLVEIIKQTRMAKSEHWVSLTVTAHELEAQGQIDGVSLLMHPLLESDGAGIDEDGMVVDDDDDDDDDDNEDVKEEDVMEITATTTPTPTATAATVADAAPAADSSSTEIGERHSSGLQRFTCYQFVDA